MIKNFLYLDEYKLYSLSSQIFEGITEYLVSDSSNITEDNESQKGSVGSGRILANILKNENRTTEKKFLHDFSYTLFEKQLFDMKKVLEINNEDFDNSITSIDEYSFVKISGSAVFNDLNSINYSIENFNDFGKALTHVTNYNELEEVKKQLEIAKSKTKDKNKKSKLNTKFKSLTNINKLAKEQGLQQDQTFLENLSYLLKYGYQDQFEVQVTLQERLFSANLKREYLRENENLIIKKYSRKTEKDFIIFGVVTQHLNGIENDLDESKEDPSLKEALMHIVSKLSALESIFIGKLPNEIIIDPIAIYTDL